MLTFLPDESVEMENDEYDDNGLPSFSEQNVEDDNGVDPNFKDGRNATELQRCALVKPEDTGGTIEDFREQNDIGRQNESQFASTSIGDGVSPVVVEQSKVICGADDQDCGADQSENCSTGRSNGGNQDDMNEKQVTIEQSIDPDRGDVPGALSVFQDLALPENVGGGLHQPPSDEATVEDGSIRGSDQALDDELSQMQKASPDNKGSLADVHEIEVKTDEIQTYEDKTFDSFDTGTTGILPAAATGTEDAPSRKMFPVLSDSVEEFHTGPSKDVRKGPTDFGRQDGKTREIIGQREEASSDFADIGSPRKNGKHSGNKSAKVPIFSAKMNFMMTAIFCLSFSVTRGVAALTVIPGDVLAASGSIARIRCSTDYKSPVYWDRKPFGSDEQETIYYGKNGMARIAGGRIRVEEDSSSSGRYDLVISDVQMEDAGTYTCIDEAGIGEGYPAELVVFERFTCELPVPRNGFMGENIFEIPEEPVESTCSLSLRGSVVPRFQWTWGKVARLLTPTSINGSTVTSSVMLRATRDMNGVKVTCLPVVSTDSDSLDDSPRWISEAVVVRYVHVMFGSVDECQSNAMIPVCNPNCTYKVQVTPDNRCQCLAVYNVEGRTYNKIFSEYSCGISESSSSVIIIVVVIVAFAVLVTAASAIIVVVLRKIRRKERGYQEEKPGIGETKQPLNDTTTENKSDSQSPLMK